MKRKEILVLLGEVLGSRAVYSVASLVITITMLSGITIILRNDIRDIKNYVQSVVDGDPNYKEIHSQVTGSENVIRGNIDLETLLAKEDKKAETTSTANNISSGYDNYTPTQTITDDYNNKPSNGLNNSNSGETTIANNNNSNSNNNNNSNNSTNEVNNNNNNSDEDKKEDVLDRSSFNGKDVMVSEGEPFNPMNALQLAATDINGKNITNKIVITENNVDTYKPGLYTVKANVTLSNENTLEKEFLVRVEPTILNLAVNDLKISKDVLEKNEHFNLTFAVKSSKSYLEVSSVNINNKDYSVKQTSSNSFFRTSNKYEVNLVAPSKAGTEKIEIKSVTMSDGTIVDINKSVNVEVSKEDAYLSDVIIEDKSSANNSVRISFKLNDIDDTIKKARVCIYNENNRLVAEEEVLKDNNASYTEFYSIINLKESGNYIIKVIANKNTEESEIESYVLNEIELLSENITINIKPVIDNSEEDLELLPMLSYSEELEVETYSENEEDSLKTRSVRSRNQTITGSDTVEHKHEISITGNVLSDTGEFPPGTLQIVVPTTASFTITEKGDFITTPITIKNEGYQNIDVYVYKFIDVNKTEGINIKKKSEIVDANRSNVALNILGNQSVAYFKTEDSNSTNSGVYKDSELSDPSTGDGINVLKINSYSIGTLTLEGSAGKEGRIEKPISDRFTLILKIKKSQNS